MTGNTFSKHIEDRTIRAMKATIKIKKLKATALKLFTIRVAFIATYDIQLIRNHLTYSKLKRLEGVKTAYLKGMLCVSNTCQIQ